MKILSSYPLSVSGLQPNPQVAHLLSSELAHRYHALPLAIDGENLTVAIAHPEDENACQALKATLGSTICWVKADEIELERLFAELWPHYAKPKLKIVTWFPVENFYDNDCAYAQSVCQQVDGELCPVEGPANLSRFLEFFAETTPISPMDLLIFRSPDPPLIKRLMLEPAEKNCIHKIPTSLWVVRNPRWPIQRILLVIHNPKSDDAALSWTIRLAKNHQAAVTVLPLIPPLPGLFAHMQNKHSISELLARDFPLGAQLRRFAQQMNEWNIDGKLHLRNEPVDQQVRCEVQEGDYDLIIVGEETQNAISRWFLGQLVNPLLLWADRPLLITKSLSI